MGLDNPYIDKEYYTQTNDKLNQIGNKNPAFDRSIDDLNIISHTKKPSNNTLNAQSHDLVNIAFMGTLVRSGNAKGIVIATGQNSTFGEVFKLMKSEEAPRTPLQRGMDRLGKQLSLISIIIIIIISIFALFQHREWLELFTIGVSLAVAAIPEGLPIVVTVTLAIGQRRMAARNAIVKKMPAVETLGCINVICSDKTGTLTRNEMTVIHLITSGLESVDVNSGDQPPRNSEPMLLWNKEYSQQTYDSIKMGNYEVNSPNRHPTVRRLIEIGCICNNARLVNDVMFGQPTEGALLNLAMKADIPDSRKMHTRLKEWPFNSETKMMIVHATPRMEREDLDFNRKKIVYFAKGCPEKIMSTSKFYRASLDKTQISSNDDGKILPLTDEVRNKFNGIVSRLGMRGLRVLGLAEGSSEREMIFTGIVAMMDPLRKGVAESICTIMSTGVKVVMITGDSKETACSISEQLSIYGSNKICLSGMELDSMDSEDLTNIIQNVSVFYRTSPKHKCKIVRAYQNLGLIVAMTGDGVNDAIAVKSADVGIAMGIGGTDVCKEAADIVLVDNNFTSILSAMEEGKSIYRNIRNFIRFQLSTSISALSLIAFSTILKIQSPLNAMQILYINILMDGPPAQSLGLEPPDDEIVKQPPRRVKDSILDLKLITSIFMSSFVILVGTLSVFYHQIHQGHSMKYASTAAFTCFVFFDIFNAISCRSENKTLFSIGLFTNRMLVITVTMSIVGQLLVLYWSPLQSIFQTVSLSISDLLYIVIITSSVFWVNEFCKVFEYSDMFSSIRHNLLLMCQRFNPLLYKITFLFKRKTFQRIIQRTSQFLNIQNRRHSSRDDLLV